MTDIFSIQKPGTTLLPVVLSVPHAGTYVPEDIRTQLKPELLPPDDTDWIVDELYGFAFSLGIPLIRANYSRWVVDLNRNPDDTPLYQDGRVITALCTTTNFNGESIYKDERLSVSQSEIETRRQLYFNPYHERLQQLLDEVKQQFCTVLLWDCHSIRRYVPSIYPQPFPDLILGSNDEQSASLPLIHSALSSLRNSHYSVSHNHPFKGGYITRHYGKPDKQQHALQLEMTKPLYMDNEEQHYDEQRAGSIRKLLINTLVSINQILLQNIKH